MNFACYLVFYITLRLKWAYFFTNTLICKTKSKILVFVDLLFCMIGTWEIDSCNLRVSITICSEQWVIPAMDTILIKSKMKSNTAARKSVLE